MNVVFEDRWDKVASDKNIRLRSQIRRILLLVYVNFILSLLSVRLWILLCTRLPLIYVQISFEFLSVNQLPIILELGDRSRILLSEWSRWVQLQRLILIVGLLCSLLRQWLIGELTLLTRVGLEDHIFGFVMLFLNTASSLSFLRSWVISGRWWRESVGRRSLLILVD